MPRIEENEQFSDEIWEDENGVVTRTDGPAQIRRYADGRVTETWFSDGQKHRFDAPAERTLRPDGTEISQLWYEYGSLHREDGPAEILRNRDGALIFERWYDAGQLHREDGPASIEYDPATGQVLAEIWYSGGQVQAH